MIVVLVPCLPRAKRYDGREEGAKAKGLPIRPAHAALVIAHTRTTHGNLVVPELSILPPRSSLRMLRR